MKTSSTVLLSAVALGALLIGAHAAEEEMEALKTELPRPMFVGTPVPVKLPHLEKPLGHKRPDFMVPKGTTNLALEKDVSNPYFTFDPSRCIVCSRCVRACDEVQGTFALTVAGRGFDSRISASQEEPFLDSECGAGGACGKAGPTASLAEL